MADAKLWKLDLTDGDYYYVAAESARDAREIFIGETECAPDEVGEVALVESPGNIQVATGDGLGSESLAGLWARLEGEGAPFLVASSLW